MLAEKTQRCRLYAVQTVAEVDLVQVHLQDLILGEFVFEAPREHRFLQFSSQGLVGRQKVLARELLRQRAAALHGTSRAQVGQGSGGDANDIDSVVLVEALILNGDDGMYQVW